MAKKRKMSTEIKSKVATPSNAVVALPLSKSDLGKPVSHEVAFRAQELVYDAMEAETWEQRLRLAKRAQKLDPANVDSLLMLVDGQDLDENDRIEILRLIVDIGAKRLGKAAFKELAPHFWGFLETRPYMRAREQLAHALMQNGRLDDAARQFEGMLELNPNDNQGVRYLLLPIYLANGNWNTARELMSRYKNDCEFNVAFAWGLVLERFMNQGETKAAAALASARNQNPHVEPFLTGRKKLPKRLPGLYSPGSQDEALCFAEPLLVAWSHHPTAQAWLKKSPAAPKQSSATNQKRTPR